MSGMASGHGGPRRWIVTLVLAATALCGSPGRGIDADALRREQAAQARAAQIARDLIRTTLDVQVRQLEDNRLAGDNPLYQEVIRMRSSIDGLMAGEMRSVVDLIERARTAEGPAREAAFNEARGQVREIVGRLSEERARLRRRLRLARLSADARQVLQLQVAVHDATRGLVELQDPRRLEAAALRTIEDQRNVQLLFLKLADVLAEVADWGPPSGPAAVRGLQMVKSHRIEPILRETVDDLENVRLAEAVARQKQVIAGLEAVLARVEGPAAAAPRRPAAAPSGSAAELATLATRLRGLREGLEPVLARQREALARVQADPAAAAAIEGEIATFLDSARGDAAWPDAVAEWLDQAVAAAGEATSAGDAGALSRAAEALARLDAEARVAAADVDRTALAVRVGELNRAIEVLERAAASQRRLAMRSRAGAIAEDEAAVLARRQESVAEITAAVAEAVPDVAGVGALVAAARTAAAEAGRRLTAAPPAPAAVAEAAEEAAGRFGEAATVLRRRMLETAAAVDALTARQLAEVTAVEAEIRMGPAADGTAAARLARLEQAARLVRKAAVEQLRAEGRGAAADLRETRDEIEEVAALQSAADAEAARAAATGGGSLEAAARQQAVADAVAAIAARRTDLEAGVREALARAAEAAGVAASETVGRGASAAEPFRRLARRALDEAVARANRGLTEDREPNRPVDPASQDRVTALAGDAAGLAETVPEAATRLAEAVKESTAAAERTRAGDDPPAAAARRRTADALDAAGERLAEARRQLAAEVKAEVAAAAAEARRLAVEADQVAPKAGSALREAAAAEREPPAGGSPRGAREEQSRMIDEARAELAARRKELERDRRLAAELAALAGKESEDRARLAELANQPPAASAPSQPAPPPPGTSGGSPQTPRASATPTPPGPQPPAATGVAPQQPPRPRQVPDEDAEPADPSKALANALTEYAESQRSLGETAEQLAKQKEIKNQPLAKALERAEELAADLEKARPQEFIPTPQPLFAPSDKPPLPEQASTGGVVPKQGKQDPEAASEPKPIPPQTQGPQNPASTQQSPPITPNPQEQLPADRGPMATQTVQTAPVTSSAQQATPPSAADVFQPNEGAPKSATPTSRSSPPEGKKPKTPAGEPAAEQGEKQEQPAKRVRYVMPEDAEPLQPSFTPPRPLDTAAEIAGPQAEAALLEAQEETTPRPEKERPPATDEPEPDEGPIEEVVLQRSQNPPAPPEEQPGETGTTPGDLGMGQGTPGKGVGGDSASPPTEQRPQQGNQHGKFDGREIEGEAPPVTPQGKPPGAAPPPPKPGKPPKPPGEPPPDELPGKPPEASPLTMPEIGGSVAPGNPADVNQVGEFTPGAPVFAEPQAGDGSRGPDSLDRPLDEARGLTRDPAAEAWFGKLPPGVQKSLRAEPPRPLPRGYEDRLRRYLRNVE